MWAVRLAHPAVNRFRVIAEHTREAAEKKAADQMQAWEAEFSAPIATAAAVSRREMRWLDPKAMKQLLSPEQRNRQLAEQLTAQVQEEMLTLRSLLLYGTLVKYGMTPPTSPKPEDVPAEPQRESYVPHLGFADYVIPGFRKRKRAEAAERFAAMHAGWKRLSSEVTAMNRERMEAIRRLSLRSAARF